MKRILAIVVLKILGLASDFLEEYDKNKAAEWEAHFVPTGVRGKGTEKY